MCTVQNSILLELIPPASTTKLTHLASPLLTQSNFFHYSNSSSNAQTAKQVGGFNATAPNKPLERKQQQLNGSPLLSAEKPNATISAGK
jgi:hypothetical protein